MAALQDPVGFRVKPGVTAVAEFEPVDLSVARPPDEVLGDTAALVGAALRVEVDGDAARRDLDDEFGGALKVIVGVAPRESRFSAEQEIRLYLRACPQPDSGIIEDFTARVEVRIDREPCRQTSVWSAVRQRDWRCHVHHSLDELRLDIGHGFVAPLELRA